MPSLYVFASVDNGRGNEVWLAGAGLENPRLLKDINPGIQSSDPNQFTALPDGRLVFVANDGVHGRELWVTDGTEGGTRMLRDVGTSGGTGGPEQLTLLPNGSILFTADTGTAGRELWLTDGTADGTRLLKDIHPGTASSDISDVIAIAGGRYLFSADDGVHGKELWMTDGTAEGTHLVKDMTPGAFGTDLSLARVDGDGSAHFAAGAEQGYDGDPLAVGGEWKSDGTAEGTHKISDGYPRSGAQPAGQDGDIFVYKEFYTGPGGDRNFILALYASDGTPEGTHMLLDNLGSPGAPSDVYALGNGLVVFPQGDDLMVTDGTVEGTKVIGRGSLTGFWMQDFTVLPDGRALFINRDNFVSGSSSPGGYTTSDLWITDGTEGGTFRISPQSSSNPASLSDIAHLLDDGSIVFSAPSFNGSNAVWKVGPALGSIEQVERLHFSDGTAFHALTIPAPPSEPHQWSAQLPLFDITYYLESNPDVASSGMDPLQHFLQFGGLEGRSPNSEFDSTFYLSQYPDVASSGINPFLHYLVYGWQEGRMASARNDFQSLHSEVGTPEMTALAHDLLVSKTASQNPQPGQDSPPAVHPSISLVDTKFYYEAYQDVAQAGVDASEHYMTFGWHEGRDPDALFDTSYYLDHNADVAAAGVNPLEHYLQFGAKEGRDPSPLFGTGAYLARYNDVAAAGVNPLLHYLQFGMAEGRDIFPA